MTFILICDHGSMIEVKAPFRKPKNIGLLMRKSDVIIIDKVKKKKKKSRSFLGIGFQGYH